MRFHYEGASLSRGFMIPLVEGLRNTGHKTEGYEGNLVLLTVWSRSSTKIPL